MIQWPRVWIKGEVPCTSHSLDQVLITQNTCKGYAKYEYYCFKTVNMVIFAGEKFRKYVGKTFHLVGNFHDTTPISLK